MNILQKFNYDYIKSIGANKLSKDERKNKLKNFKDFIGGKERMKIMREQLQESKIKLIQDYQERMVEGQLMKLNMQKALEEEKRNNELREKQKKEMQKEYFDSNERLRKAKEEQRQKDIEEEKKIEEFAIKKQQRDDLRKKVEDQKLKQKIDNHQKLIDIQFNNLLKIQQEKNDALNKSIENSLKARDQKEGEEEKKNLEKRNKILNDIKQQMINSQKEKEEKRLREKQEDLNYIDDFKKKLALLEESERNEMMDKRRRERDLAEYRRLQTEEKRRIALRDFEAINEDTYKQLKRLDMEDDDFMKYAEYWISEYKKQGKNIIPLLLELKRYKKNYSLE